MQFMWLQYESNKWFMWLKYDVCNLCDYNMKQINESALYTRKGSRKTRQEILLSDYHTCKHTNAYKRQ